MLLWISEIERDGRIDKVGRMALYSLKDGYYNIPLSGRFFAYFYDFLEKYKESHYGIENHLNEWRIIEEEIFSALLIRFPQREKKGEVICVLDINNQRLLFFVENEVVSKIKVEDILKIDFDKYLDEIEKKYFIN